MFKIVPFLVFLVFSLVSNSYNLIASCDDGIKNGREVDVDCGGDCDACDTGLSTGLMITVDETTDYQYRHAIWLPPGYDSENSERELPLIIFLHGNGEINNTTTAIQNHGPMKHRDDSWWDYPFIMVNPVRGGNVVVEELETFVNEIIDAYHVDESRMYLTGLSGGSFGLSEYVKAYPDKMAAVVSISGYVPTVGSTFCTGFKGTPLWYFHNIGDGTVSLTYSTLDDFDVLQERCGNPQPDPYIFLSVFDTNGHDAWSKVYNPFLNEGNDPAYANQYALADLTYLTESNTSDDTDYDIYQTTFGLPNDIESIYDWFLRYENIPNSCRNETQDNDETGVDCGGSCKPCTSSYTCHNGVLDSGEASIDCGGSCPACEREMIWEDASWNSVDGPIESDNVTVKENFSGEISCKDLTISSGVTFTVDGTLDVKGNLSNEGTLIVNSGSSLITYDGNAISDNVIIRRNTRYADYRYSFVGTPVASNASVLISNLGSNVYTYDESQSSTTDDLTRWVSPSISDMLVPGLGYTQTYLQTLEFVGSPNSGTIVYDAGFVHDGWHLVSNPYPAAISLEGFLDANENTTGAIYIWDDHNSSTERGTNQDYIVVNKTAAIDLSGPDNDSRWNGNIGSCQGFFIQMDGAPGDITFHESMRVSGVNSDDNFFRVSEAEIPLLRINLTNDREILKQTVIGWNQDVSNQNLTRGFDAPFPNFKPDNRIFSFKSNQELAIQTINQESVEVLLGYEVEKAGSYRLVFEMVNQNESYYLIDKKNNEYMGIDHQVGYEFSTLEGSHHDRFSVVKKDVVLNNQEGQFLVYTYDKVLYFITQKRSNYQLFDIKGQTIQHISTKGEERVDLRSLPDGIYILSDGLSSVKILLR